MPERARIVSVNVGGPAPLGTWRGQTIHSSIVKAPVEGRVRAEGINLTGDRQTDWRVHGGPDKAVYAYAFEDVEWWEGELGCELAPGTFGENLTTCGLDCSGAVIGERWRIGTALLEVAQPRIPCFKLGLRFGDPTMVRRFGRASRPGAYLRIVEEGELGAGDAVEVVERPDHGVTVALVSDAMLVDRSLAARARVAPQLAEGMREHLDGLAA